MVSTAVARCFRTAVDTVRYRVLLMMTHTIDYFDTVHCALAQSRISRRRHVGDHPPHTFVSVFDVKILRAAKSRLIVNLCYYRIINC